jgi:ribosomal protein S18 acetylase RimI-like enzyme
MAKTSTLSASELAALPCPYCGRVVQPKTEWAQAAMTAWGFAAIAVTRADEVAGVLALAPGERADEARIKMVWVRPESSGYGLGRQLVQAAAAELFRRRMKALVASGSRSNFTCASPPREFLMEVGFTRRPDQRLYRLDLRQTVLGRTHLGLFGRLVRGFNAGPEPGVVSGRIAS